MLRFSFYFTVPYFCRSIMILYINDGKLLTTTFVFVGLLIYSDSKYVDGQIIVRQETAIEDGKYTTQTSNIVSKEELLMEVDNYEENETNCLLVEEAYISSKEYCEEFCKELRSRIHLVKTLTKT